jgi:phage protein U
MLMALGEFVFSLPTLAFQDLSRRTSWRWAENSRIGVRAASQFLGPGEDTITLAGLLVPQVIGDASSIRQLRALGDQGEAWPLVDGTGRVHGAFVLTDLEERQTMLLQDGVPRRTDFSITLKHVDDADAHAPTATASEGAAG